MVPTVSHGNFVADSAQAYQSNIHIHMVTHNHAQTDTCIDIHVYTMMQLGT